MLLKRIQKLPIGYSELFFNKVKYGVIRSDYNKGKSYKIYAEALSGNDFISLNYYITNTKEHLKPCEMAEIKVINFLNNYSLI